MDWTKILEIAVAVVGILEWVKGLLPKAPTWIWAAASAVGCVGVAAASFYLPPWFMLGLMALAVAQLSYQSIVQFIKSKIPSAPVG